MLTCGEKRTMTHMVDDIKGIRDSLTSRGKDGMGTNTNVVEALGRIEDAIRLNTETLQLQVKALTIIAERL